MTNQTIRVWDSCVWKMKGQDCCICFIVVLGEFEESRGVGWSGDFSSRGGQVAGPSGTGPTILAAGMINPW